MQVGDLARKIQMKKDQAELAGVHEEKGKAAHPEELLASVAAMQKQVRRYQLPHERMSTQAHAMHNESRAGP